MNLWERLHTRPKTMACTAATIRLLPFGGMRTRIPGVNTKKRRAE